jgi:hypothetical protein
LIAVEWQDALAAVSVVPAVTYLTTTPVRHGGRGRMPGGSDASNIPPSPVLTASVVYRPTWI